MKNQALFPSKDKSKKLKCRLLQFLFGALRVSVVISIFLFYSQVEELLSCFHGIFGRCSVMYYDFEAYNATFYGVCQDISCKYYLQFLQHLRKLEELFVFCS